MTNIEKRWAELRLYYFCYDIFSIRKNITDIPAAIEAVAQIGTFKELRIKKISAKILSNPYIRPTLKELVHMMSDQGYPTREIAKHVEKTPNYITKILRKEPTFISPTLPDDEIEEIVKFLELLDKFQKAGVPCHS